MKTRWMILLLSILFMLAPSASAKKVLVGEDTIEYVAHQKAMLVDKEKGLEAKKKIFEKELFLQMQAIEQERDSLFAEKQVIANMKESLDLQRKDLIQIETRVKSVAQGKVISIYAKMKAKEAAKIIAQMLPKRKKEVLAIIMELEERQARAIVSKLPSDVSATITEALWNFSQEKRNLDND